MNGHLLEVELNDPTALLGAAAEPASARAEAEADPDVWAVLITATGTDPLAAADLEPPADEASADPATAAFAPWAKPLILAAAGSVSGAGFELAMAADLLVATPDTRFLLPAPDPGGASRRALARCFDQLPYRVVTSLAMTGRPLTAGRAHELGFVNALADDADLEAEARKWADSILAVSPLAIAAIREAATDGLGKNLAAAIAARYPAVERYAASADASDAVSALVEGRRPQWRGR